MLPHPKRPIAVSTAPKESWTRKPRGILYNKQMKPSKEPSTIIAPKIGITSFLVAYRILKLGLGSQ